jgi:hypothetical protein
MTDYTQCTYRYFTGSSCTVFRERLKRLSTDETIEKGGGPPGGTPSSRPLATRWYGVAGLIKPPIPGTELLRRWAAVTASCLFFVVDPFTGTGIGMGLSLMVVIGLGLALRWAIFELSRELL